MSYVANYICVKNLVANLQPDQTVIIQKRFLQRLPRQRNAEPPSNIPQKAPASTDDVDEFYPAVNSYYSFSEDVDAFARVHHLLESKSSTECIEEEQSKSVVINQYDERDAQIQYLQSNPINFLLLGKPGFGQEEIGRRLASYWKCVYIDPLSLLEDEIASGSRPGECIEFNLRCGRAIGIDVISRLLIKKVQTPSVKHRGFVLCGFPLVPNDLYEEDPISSESAIFNVREIFDELIDHTIRIVDFSSKVAVSIAEFSKESEDVTREISLDEYLEEPAIDTKIVMDWEVEPTVCRSPEISSDLQMQLNIIFGLYSTPFMIIYVAGRNSDVETKRDNYSFDIYAKRPLDMQKIHMFTEFGASDDHLIDDLFGDGRNPFAENPTLKHVVKVPENFPAHVSTQLDRYHTEIANTLDVHILQHDHQFYLKLDGRSYISQMVHLVKLRLKVLPLQPVIVPQIFHNTDIAGEDDTGHSPEEVFLKLSRQEVISFLYKWTWSDWGAFCPVAMTSKNYIKGSSECAAHFGNFLFFFLGDENFYLFNENPRPYLLPPFPKAPPYVFVIGPPHSGKSAVAQCLGYLLNSEVLKPDKMYDIYFHQEQLEYEEQVRQLAMVEAMEILKERYIESMENLKKHSSEWESKAIALLKKIVFKTSDSLEDISSFPIALQESTVTEQDIKERLKSLNLPEDLDVEQCTELLENRNLLHEYLPVQLRSSSKQPIFSVLDPFVLEYAEKKVKAITLEEVKSKMKGSRFDMYCNSIRACQNQEEFDGWVIDGMATDVDLLRKIYQEFTVNEVIILISSDYDYLLERFKKGGNDVSKFHNFREFFLKIRETDAAWRTPSDDGSETYYFMQDIVNDIFTAVFDDEETVIENYQNTLISYKQELEKIYGTLQNLGVEPLILDVNGLTIEQLLKELVFQYRDKYRRQPLEYSEMDRSEEVQQYLSKVTQGGEGEGDHEIADDFLARNRRYGDTFHYCPVTFFEKFVLWRGKEKYAVKFCDKIYLCANESNLHKFSKAPREYLLLKQPPKEFPPPRFCVISPSTATRTYVAKQLARNLGVRYVNFADFKVNTVNALSSMSLLYNPEEKDVPEAFVEDFYEMLFSKHWFEEPFKHSGFVIDGFPEHERCVKYMTQYQAVPSVILYISLSSEENLKIELDYRLGVWKKKREEERQDQEMLNEMIVQDWTERRKLRYDELIEPKREKRYSKKLSESKVLRQKDQGELSESQISIDSVLDQADQDEVMRILDQELPEPVFEFDLESEEAMIEKLTIEIEDEYKADSVTVDELKQICERELIPLIGLDGSKSLERIVRHAMIIGNDAKFTGPSFFERCYDVSPDLAEKLLDSGYYFLSSFGTFCPVQYYMKHNTLHMYVADMHNENVYPVIHRQYIYFLSGKKNCERFVKNPLKYTTQQFYRLSIPLRIAVVGPPRSGKTTIAKRFGKDLGFKVLTRGDSIRYVLSNPIYTNLLNSVETILRKGETLPDDLVMECVQAASFCGESLTQALVFDGFPNTVSEMTVLSKLGLVPHLIFDLHIPKLFLHRQAAEPSGKYPEYSNKFFTHRLNEWIHYAEIFRPWCDREYQNVYKIEVNCCIWGIWERVKEVALSVHFERQHYYKHINLDWPLRVANMLVTPLEFMERESPYKTFCLGCLFYLRKLTNGGEPPDRTGLVQYRKYFYWLCQEHIEDFLKEPDRFLPPSNIGLPFDIPKKLLLDNEPQETVEDGYCLVCYKMNFPKKVLNRGNFHHAVLYRGKIFLFDDDECQNIFMSTPEKFCYITIKFKDDFHICSLNYRDLPVLGMLEQYVAKEIIQALTHTNIYRPVIPGLTISQAGLICAALKLKISTSKPPEKQKYETALNKFHETRQNLIKYLDMMKHYMNPLVRYKEPNLPSSDEDEDEEK